MKEGVTTLTAFDRWVELCRYAERFGYSFAPRDDKQFDGYSFRFLEEACSLSPAEQFELRQHMHDYGCPYALHYFEAKVLDDLLWWRPSAEPQLLLPDKHELDRNT